ncbi:Peroxiredoxin [Tenacibaculum sp. 190524A05c]
MFFHIFVLGSGKLIMKNILITIVTMAVAFGITFYVLSNFYKKDNELEFNADGTATFSSTTEPEDTYTEETSDDSNDESSDDNTKTTSTTDFSDNDMFPDLDVVLADSDKWETYFKENINLSSDFIPLDTDGEEIEKSDFLSDLTSGSFVPLKLLSGDQIYQLYPTDEIDDKGILSFSKSEADVAYAYFSKEGTKLPEFNFQDINGNRYSSGSTNGKIIIITCWHMGSKTSIREFPKLNRLYDKYEAYEDVVFLSLAFDKSDKLLQFLTKNEFRHPVIANQEAFMRDEIGAKQYPTHLIIDEDGNIEKMVSSVGQLEAALQKIAEPDLTEFNDGGM